MFGFFFLASVSQSASEKARDYRIDDDDADADPDPGQRFAVKIKKCLKISSYCLYPFE